MNTSMRRFAFVLVLPALAACAGSAPPASAPARPFAQPLPPALPDTSVFGTHVLAMARSPRGELWVGTYGKGIYMLPADTMGAVARGGRRPPPRVGASGMGGAGMGGQELRGPGDEAPPTRTNATWRHIESRANDSTSISFNIINGFAFTRDSSTVWYS